MFRSDFSKNKIIYIFIKNKQFKTVIKFFLNNFIFVLVTLLLLNKNFNVLDEDSSEGLLLLKNLFLH